MAMAMDSTSTGRLKGLEGTLLAGKKRLHFIGIGGSGMYPLAQILNGEGFQLTGSDNNETDNLEAVRRMGIPVSLGQKAENIGDAEVVVYSAAIPEDNPELTAARVKGLPVLERSQLLGIITQLYSNAICVSGTHGKTTATAMLTQILLTAGQDISAYIGGKLPLIGGSGRAGTTDTLTCEACEFVDTFLKLSPDVAVILNIDADHLDYFKTVDNTIRSFTAFANKAQVIIYNGDDSNTLKAIGAMEKTHTEKEFITFGWSSANDFWPDEIERVTGMETAFTLMHGKESLCRVTLHVPGRHNILNALAAIAAALKSGASKEAIVTGLEGFHGALRRFEKIGEVGGITIADDYAHHPAELEVTLKVAKDLDFRRVWAVFQPFTFSRTAMLLEDFAKSLSIADLVVLTEIMGSREKNTYHIYAKDLGERIQGAVWFDDLLPNESAAEYHDRNFAAVAEYLADHARPGDLIITLGCGDVYKVARQIKSLLEEKDS